MLHSKVKKYLEMLEQEDAIFASNQNEYKIADKLDEIYREDKEYKMTNEDIAEQSAFLYKADHPKGNFDWGTYYGPIMTFKNENEQMVEYPGISKINEEILQYWTKRAKQSPNPVLSSRYADLVVDFSSKVLKKGADIDLFQIVINLNIIICEKLLAHPMHCKIKIKRALLLAIQLNNQEWINKVKNAIIQFEKNITRDGKAGYWGFSFQWLLLDFPKKVFLDENEENALVNEVEERLERVKGDDWLTKNAIDLLSKYYSKKKDEENLMRVLSVRESTIKGIKRSDSEALLKMHDYTEMQEMYQEYASGFSHAENANKRISKEIGQLNLDWKKSMKRVTFDMEIPKEHIEKHLTDIFGKNKNNSLDAVMINIASIHLLRKNDIEKSLSDSSSENPLQYLVTQQIISPDQNLTATLSGLEEDYDNYFINHARQYAQVGAFFLALTMSELREHFREEQIIEYFQKSLIFQSDKTLKEIISAYWEEKHLVASHLFSPMIERGIRKLIKDCGGSYLEGNKLKGYTNMSLGSILRKNAEIFQKVYSKSGHDVLFYFQLMLNEKLGMNLRNDLAHGADNETFHGQAASNWFFHISILLAILRKKEQHPNSESTQPPKTP